MLFDLIAVLDVALKVLKDYSVIRRRIEEIEIFKWINTAQLCGFWMLL